MPSDNAFDQAHYQVFRYRERRWDGSLVEHYLPYCKVTLKGDVETSSFWMSPSPRGANAGNLGLDATYLPLDVEVVDVTETSPIHPTGKGNDGYPLQAFQWSDPSV